MNIILFDGVCNLCSGIVSFIIKRDKKDVFRFAALQSGAGKDLLRRYALPEDQNDTIYYLRDDKYDLRSTAILHILHDLGKGWQIAYFLILIPVGIRDAIYRLIARNRYRLFGKKTSCLVPSPEIRKKFIV